MSTEAMAIMDYKDHIINLEHFDRCCREQQPLYLQAEQNVLIQVDKEGHVDVGWMKAKLRERAKPVALKQETSFHVKNGTCKVSS